MTLLSQEAWKKHKPAGVKSLLCLDRNSATENVRLLISLLSHMHIESVTCIYYVVIDQVFYISDGQMMYSDTSTDKSQYSS